MAFGRVLSLLRSSSRRRAVSSKLLLPSSSHGGSPVTLTSSPRRATSDAVAIPLGMRFFSSCRDPWGIPEGGERIPVELHHSKEKLEIIPGPRRDRWDIPEGEEKIIVELHDSKEKLEISRDDTVFEYSDTKIVFKTEAEGKFVAVRRRLTKPDALLGFSDASISSRGIGYGIAIFSEDYRLLCWGRKRFKNLDFEGSVQSTILQKSEVFRHELGALVMLKSVVLKFFNGDYVTALTCKRGQIWTRADLYIDCLAVIKTLYGTLDSSNTRHSRYEMTDEVYNKIKSYKHENTYPNYTGRLLNEFTDYLSKSAASDVNLVEGHEEIEFDLRMLPCALKKIVEKDRLREPRWTHWKD